MLGGQPFLSGPLLWAQAHSYHPGKDTRGQQEGAHGPMKEEGKAGWLGLATLHSCGQVM